jgi:hypothetical protein
MELPEPLYRGILLFRKLSGFVDIGISSSNSLQFPMAETPEISLSAHVFPGTGPDLRI